jgi:hypothetical protein
MTKSAYQELLACAIMTSEYRQNVFPPLLTGCGNRPDFTPAHHVDGGTGMIFKQSETLSNRSSISKTSPSFKITSIK